MTRLGWGILLLIVGGIALFGSMLSFGSNGSVREPLVSLRREQPAVPTVPVDPLADTGTRISWNGPLLTVPVAGVPRAAIASSWGDPRGDGTRAHRGHDIMAPRGTPVLAAADGVIEKLFESGGGGGTTLYVRSLDSRWSYYYAHLAGYAPGIREGFAVRAGDVLGYVGDTGNAGPGNYHLHFGMHLMQPGDDWHQGRAVDPTPLLAGTAAAR
ncbi:M23 family metallopeptidase [Sphingomonas qomolangmaensis]|uniref:M23 family metallopeptidase n=1 Tax=Sphingomonas qomolangmaensis TaxID=2918765 RepID=A0ABY5L8J8_9SPHN|nr:M23 family metallopeptidase [Sphingomonas qomolangmaensis]UUL83293.1 M23 family metallopeptidase [Sphingomonas qomolangmaensis]